MVAWELVQGAWTQDGENWCQETLDGSRFSLPEPPEGEVWDRTQYNLPENGVLRVRYEATMRRPKMSDIVDRRLQRMVVSMMNDRAVVDKGLALLTMAAKEWVFSAEDAASLLGRFNDSASRIQGASVLLPRIVDDVNVNGLLFEKLSNRELIGLEKKIGKLFYFVACNPTGHYKLQLDAQYDYEILKKIIEIASEEDDQRRQAGLLDTSQKGDWDNMRNETLNGKPYDFNEHKVNSGELPRTGTLEFDYVSTEIRFRMAANAQPMPPCTFNLFTLHLRRIQGKGLQMAADIARLKREEAQAAAKKAPVEKKGKGKSKGKKKGKKKGKGKGKGKSKGKVKVDEEAMVMLAELDDTLEADGDSTEVTEMHAKRQELILVNSFFFGDRKKGMARTIELITLAQSNYRGWRARMDRQVECEAEPERRAVRRYNKKLAKRHLVHMEEQHEIQSPVTPGDNVMISENVSGAKQRVQPRYERECWWTPGQMTPLTLLQAGQLKLRQRIELIGERQLHVLRRSTSMHYFSAAQMKQLVKLVPATGGCRVEACIILFGRIKDLEAVDFGELLTAEEENMLWRRLGAANCFNPYRPEREGVRKYDLQLKYNDDRQVAQMLVQLEAEESGESMPVGTTDFNGIPIDSGTKTRWAKQVPDVGRFQCEYRTASGSINVAARTKIARRLLMPGANCWKILLERNPQGLSKEMTMDGWMAMAEAGEQDVSENHWELDVDGTMWKNVNGSWSRQTLFDPKKKWKKAVLLVQAANVFRFGAIDQKQILEDEARWASNFSNDLWWFSFDITVWVRPETFRQKLKRMAKERTNHLARVAEQAATKQAEIEQRAADRQNRKVQQLRSKQVEFDKVRHDKANAVCMHPRPSARALKSIIATPNAHALARVFALRRQPCNYLRGSCSP
jgi:hypothetical protein